MIQVAVLHLRQRACTQLGVLTTVYTTPASPTGSPEQAGLLLTPGDLEAWQAGHSRPLTAGKPATTGH